VDAEAVDAEAVDAEAVNVQAEKNRLIIVSNRLPVVFTKDTSGGWQVGSGAGGLITALAPVLRNRGGVWIGWPGLVQEDGVDFADLLDDAVQHSGYSLRPVLLNNWEKENYYRGFANEIIWPLFHDLQSHCRFYPDYWRAYRTVNHKFCEAIAHNSGRDDFIWVHDYHLMSVASALRDRSVKNRLGFFLHIPFPPLDIYLKLPWRFQILRHLLQYDLIGFQTTRDRRNFLGCVRALVKEAFVTGKGSRATILTGPREINVGTFPISIDYKEFAQHAESKEVSDTAWYIHEQYQDQKIILGVDRLDYTKGILEKLMAFRNALHRYPELQEKVVMVQVVVPSRWEIPHYNTLKEEIERLVGEINGEFTRPGWMPLHYIYRHLDRAELLSYYRTAEIMLTTPWKDGMNLVAKEYCACNIEQNGVLILSEFAGATAQMYKHSLAVNPHDIEGVADAIHTAINMSADERARRMSAMRRAIRRQDVFWWVNAFLQAAIDKRLDNFPVVEEWVPSSDVHAEGEGHSFG
jgi:trehalose 6-phosphate synthase